MKKRFLLPIALLALPLSGCREDLLKYPEWARALIVDGYAYSNAFPVDKVSAYLKVDSLPLPEMDFPDYVTGYVPPTNGKAPFYAVFINSLVRSELTASFAALDGYELRTSFANYDFILHGDGDFAVSVSTLKTAEKTSEGTTYSDLMTLLKFYKSEDVPHANE